PTLLECMTFRFYGHNFGDDDSYIPPAQKAAAIEADPVPRLRARLIADRIATEEELAAMEADIEAQIDDALEFALASPWPEPDSLRFDVFEKAMSA
ncbi:thiamine pyrophosphate-dependent enzyme, partial [Shinella sp.]|uniref:thiamine pyrophosphate-dependent enzyme n=1 Tax=Shinella sp. TaxID=1870904 RepID=UPI00403718CD